MKELDFSHFKKIQQDKKSAVLKHPDGHEIKIAISGLSPILKKKLIGLPLHAAEQDTPIEALDDSSPAQVEDRPESKKEGTSKTELAGVKEDVAPSLSPEALDQSVLSPTPGPSSGSPPAMPPAPPEAASTPPQPNQTPAPAAAPVAPPAAPPTPMQEAQQKTAENLAFADDLKFGRLHPKTYKDLFNDQDTPGKVGTLFGLLLAGVGSGLTGQPNAVLGMMDKQIERDLDAQKQDQSNKQNWYKAALEHEKNQPENMQKWAQAQASMSDADFQDWSNQNLGVIKSKATVDAMNAQRAAMAQSFQDTISKMPDGPQKVAAQAQHDNMVVPYLVNKAAQDNLDQANKKAAVNAMNPLPIKKANPPPSKGFAQLGTKYDAVDENHLGNMLQLGGKLGDAKASMATDPKTGRPSAIPPREKMQVIAEKKALEQNRDNWADTAEAFDNLAKLNNAGQVPGVESASSILGTIAGSIGTIIGGPGAGALAATGTKLVAALPGETIKHYFERNREIQIGALAERLGVNKSDEAKMRQISALMPSWADDEDSMRETHKQAMKHFANNPEEKAELLGTYGLITPQPKYKYNEYKKGKAPSTPQASKTTPAAQPPAAPSGASFFNMFGGG